MASFERVVAAACDDPGHRPVVSATALAASVIEPAQFRSGRQFAASLGLTPLQTGAAARNAWAGSAMGDKYLRKLLIVGMTSLVRRAKYKPESVDPRLVDMLERRPARVRDGGCGQPHRTRRLGDHDPRRYLSGTDDGGRMPAKEKRFTSCEDDAM